MTSNQRRATELARLVLNGRIPSQELSDDDAALLMLAGGPVQREDSLPLVCSRVLNNAMSETWYFAANGACGAEFADDSTVHRAPLKHKLSVMIVDDHEAMRRVVEKILEQAGFETHVEASCAGAMNLAQHHRPDLMILDWMLPEMSGIDLLGKLRHLYGERIPPVVIYSCRDSQDDVDTARRAGAADYWVKGRILPDEMVDRLSRLPAWIEQPSQ